MFLTFISFFRQYFALFREYWFLTIFRIFFWQLAFDHVFFQKCHVTLTFLTFWHVWQCAKCQIAKLQSWPGLLLAQNVVPCLLFDRLSIFIVFDWFFLWKYLWYICWFCFFSIIVWIYNWCIICSMFSDFLLELFFIILRHENCIEYIIRNMPYRNVSKTLGYRFWSFRLVSLIRILPMYYDIMCECQMTLYVQDGCSVGYSKYCILVMLWNIFY